MTTRNPNAKTHSQGEQPNMTACYKRTHFVDRPGSGVYEHPNPSYATLAAPGARPTCQNCLRKLAHKDFAGYASERLKTTRTA